MHMWHCSGWTVLSTQLQQLLWSPSSFRTKNETCCNSLCSSLALGIQLASEILIDLLAWLCFSISSCGASERAHTPQHRQTDCGSAGEVDRLCLSEATYSSAATHTHFCCFLLQPGLWDSSSLPHLLLPEGAAADICSSEEPKKMTSLCI